MIVNAKTVKDEMQGGYSMYKIVFFLNYFLHVKIEYAYYDVEHIQ